jgi:HPt (histidine-containing phosphotransfer) domain-containing protein
MSADLPAIDVQKARTQAGGNLELAHELFTLLRQELTNMHNSLQTLDLPAAAGALADISHKLRSSARYCAAPRLEKAADKAEKDGRAAKTPDTIAQSRRELLLAVDEILGMTDPHL